GVSFHTAQPKALFSAKEEFFMAQNQDSTRNQSTSSQSGSQGQDISRQPSTGTQAASGQSGQGSQTGSSGGNNYSFRCQDAGHQQCNWQTQGSSEDEVLRNVEPHA